MNTLSGKIACITGGTRSIGRAMAEAFLAEGAKVVVNGRDEVKGLAAVAEMGGGDNIVFFGGDASKQSTVEGLIDFTIAHFGQLDIACLNSGGVLMTAPVANVVIRRSPRFAPDASRSISCAPSNLVKL